MKILQEYRTRPQFIKAATVSRLGTIAGLEEILVHTGQHYDECMSGVFFRELEIPTPDFHLGVGSASHGAQTGRMLEAIEQLLIKVTPDWMLVYGDTNSTLAGALAAAKMNVPIAHVEAGLRSFNKRMPEEVNRVVVDHVADLLFAPTPIAVQHLQITGGNWRGQNRTCRRCHVRCDSFLPPACTAGNPGEIRHPAKRLCSRHHSPCGEHGHQESSQGSLRRTCRRGRRDTRRMPLHPRTRTALQREGLFEDARERLQLVEPLGYLDMMTLERNARLIATDSGGVQKEAFFCGVPCVTLQEETEWGELVQLGWNRLLPPRDAASVTAGIYAAFAEAVPGRPAKEPYGSGEASLNIVRRYCQGE